MRKQILPFIPIIAILLMGGWIIAAVISPRPVIAQGNDLDAILARAAAKGYLTSLKISLAASPTLTNFYLTEDVASSPIVQSLSNLQVASFEITEEQWLDDDTYQVAATISPDNRVLVSEVSKVGNRWQITNLAWRDNAAGPVTAAEAEGTTATVPADATDTGATSAPASTVNEPDSSDVAVIIGTNTTPPLAPAGSVEVLARQLNLRVGPGVVYPVRSVLNQGDVLDIVGSNSTKEWYQVAQDGVIIGWISSQPEYVATTPTAVTPPTIWVPRLPDTPARITPNTSTDAGLTTDGASGQGKLILQGSSGGDFYLVNPDGSGLRRISAGIDPALSPDGTKVAFTRWGSGQLGSIWVHDLVAGTERHILGETPQAKSPTWSPDGSQLVVNFQSGGRLKEEDKCVSPRQGIPHRAFDIEFRGNKICFKLPPDTFWHLRLIDVATGAYQDLPSETYSFAPTWDPVNDWRVVFAGSTGLQQLDLNRNTYFPFSKDLRQRGPVFSSDGSKIAISYKQHQNWEVYVIDVATGNQTRLTKPSLLADRPYNSAAPAWSPDGKQIAFVTDRSGQWEFWVMNADGSNPRPLLPPEVAAKIPVEYRGVDERLISWGE